MTTDLKTNYTQDGEYIFSVSELNRMAKSQLESHFGAIWVQGELSNVSKPASGHVYFTLKDQMGQVRGALFRQHSRGLKCNPQDGQLVLVKAKPSIYPNRGDFQLIVDQMIDYGAGLLQQQFDALKEKLAKQGLFDPAHKKSIPKSIHTLGVVTSGSGAALHDICSVMKRRFPAINIIVYCAAVQGDMAPGQLITAIKQAETENRIDALLISRGGGSAEDLWAFNDETLAKVIFDCPIPTVSAIGHEVDFTIADFVADLRAPTPSAAAEVLSPDKSEIKNRLDQLRAQTYQLLLAKHTQYNTLLNHLKKRLKHPQDILAQKAQHLDFLSNIIHKNIHKVFLIKERLFFTHQNLFFSLAPRAKVSKLKQGILDQEHRLKIAFFDLFNRKKMQLGIICEKCDTLSPLRTLSRGYAIAINEKNKVLTKSTQADIGEDISVRLSEGTLKCTVKSR